MKRLLPLFLVIVLLSLSAVSCSPAFTSTAIELPTTLKADITAVLLVAVSWLITRLVTLIPALRFLKDFEGPLALAIAAQLIGWIEASVPDVYGVVAVLALQLVLAVLALFMTFFKLKEKGVRGFK